MIRYGGKDTIRGMNIIICGGHLTPALAVIEELKNPSAISHKPLAILFIGRKHSMEGDSAVSQEYKIITRMGIPFISLAAGRLQRKFTRYTIPSLLKIPVGFFQALWWVGKFKPDIILSFGGYLAVPVVIAGWLWQVPTVSHEQTTVSGLANKIIAYFAQKICVSWPQSADHFPKKKVVLTGNPIRREIFKINKNSPYPIPDTLYPVIYITGGSLGSHVINETVVKCLPELLEKYIVIHQCGDSEKYNDYEKLKSASRRIKAELQEKYKFTQYVGPEDIGWVFNKADLVIGRAGANTVTELAALGKPAILIPIPWVGNSEQLKNAEVLANIGAAVILPQDKLNGEELKKQIDSMFDDFKNYRKNAKEATKLVNLSAASKIVKVINEVCKTSRKN